MEVDRIQTLPKVETRPFAKHIIPISDKDFDYFSFVNIGEHSEDVIRENFVAGDELEAMSNRDGILNEVEMEMEEPHLHSLWNFDRTSVNRNKIVDIVAAKLNDWEALISVLGSNFMSQVFEPNFDLLDDHCWLAFNYICIWSSLSWKHKSDKTISREGARFSWFIAYDLS